MSNRNVIGGLLLCLVCSCGNTSGETPSDPGGKLVGELLETVEEAAKAINEPVIPPDKNCESDFIIDKFDISYRGKKLKLKTSVEEWIAAIGSDYTKDAQKEEKAKGGNYSFPYKWLSKGIYLEVEYPSSNAESAVVNTLGVVFRKPTYPKDYPVGDRFDYSKYYEKCIAVNGRIIDLKATHPIPVGFRPAHRPSLFFNQHIAETRSIDYVLHTDHERKIFEFYVH